MALVVTCQKIGTPKIVEVSLRQDGADVDVMVNGYIAFTLRPNGYQVQVLSYRVPESTRLETQDRYHMIHKE